MTEWANLPPKKFKTNDVVVYNGRKWEAKDATYDHGSQDWKYFLKSGVRQTTAYERNLKRP